MEKRSFLKSAQTLSKVEQKQIRGGIDPPGEACDPYNDTCQSGKCCDFWSKRCVNEASGICID